MSKFVPRPAPQMRTRRPRSTRREHGRAAGRPNDPDRRRPALASDLERGSQTTIPAPGTYVDAGSRSIVRCHDPTHERELEELMRERSELGPPTPRLVSAPSGLGSDACQSDLQATDQDDGNRGRFTPNARALLPGRRGGPAEARQ